MEANQILDLLQDRIAIINKKEKGIEVATEATTSQTHIKEKEGYRKAQEKLPWDKQLSTNEEVVFLCRDGKIKKNRKKKPTMLLYPTEENDKTIESIIREELKEDGSNFKIKAVKKLQNKGLAIVCDKEQQFDQLKKAIESNDSLRKKISVRLPGKRFSSLNKYDLPNDTTNKDVQTALKAYLNMQKDLRL
ncbi:hypothetical protein HNY73_001560 [Argiope bruennichi]|uniref:Uncharacterized protein n=1 Tax=Argiope bruennichi TaxID=94029 RepID=A0A8T0G424_ARGBR|nr:hypothetical protein HNY73_001560 [Argiope bruennichi]